MCVLAHPDDESLGMGGTRAHYARQGVETHVVTATRGQRGRFGADGETPGPEVAGRVREQELRAAARELGVHGVSVLDHMDGELDQAEPEVVNRDLPAHDERDRLRGRPWP